MRSIGADVACAAGYPGVHDDHNRSPDRDPTVTKGLLVRLEARPGREDDVERFLVEGRSLVEQEPDTTWPSSFARPASSCRRSPARSPDLRSGSRPAATGSSSLPGQTRPARPSGRRVPRELVKHGLSLLGSLPDMDKNDVLAAKL